MSRPTLPDLATRDDMRRALVDLKIWIVATAIVTALWSDVILYIALRD